MVGNVWRVFSGETLLHGGENGEFGRGTNPLFRTLDKRSLNCFGIIAWGLAPSGSMQLTAQMVG
jgi:hypothetical protein